MLQSRASGLGSGMLCFHVRASGHSGGDLRGTPPQTVCEGGTGRANGWQQLLTNSAIAFSAGTLVSDWPETR